MSAQRTRPRPPPTTAASFEPRLFPKTASSFYAKTASGFGDGDHYYPYTKTASAFGEGGYQYPYNKTASGFGESGYPYIKTASGFGEGGYYHAPKTAAGLYDFQYKAAEPQETFGGSPASFFMKPTRGEEYPFYNNSRSGDTGRPFHPMNHFGVVPTAADLDSRYVETACDMDGARYVHPPHTASLLGTGYASSFFGTPPRANAPISAYVGSAAQALVAGGVLAGAGSLAGDITRRTFLSDA